MSGKPVLRVGIISDVQAYAYSQDWGMHNCEKAFRILADQKIDVLMNGGDIADGGDSVAPLEYYQEMVKKYFTEKENLPYGFPKGTAANPERNNINNTK